MALLAENLIYGALYMDVGEGFWEEAKIQIDLCINHSIKTGYILEDTAVGFDLIATKSQVEKGLARQMGQHIYDYVDREYPNLKSRSVGVTIDENNRPIRDSLIYHKFDEKTDFKQEFFFLMG